METTREELVEETKNGILDSLYWFLDDTIWFEYVNDEFDSAISILQAETEINDMIISFVSDLDFENGSGIMSKEFYCKDLDTFVYNVKFTFSIDMDAAIKGDCGDSMFKIILDGNEVTNYEIIQKLFSREENNINKGDTI